MESVASSASATGSSAGASSVVSSAGASSVVSSTSASAITLSSGDASSASSVGASTSSAQAPGWPSGGLGLLRAAFLVRAGFGSYFSVTSSMTAMGALSPLRGPILVIRV